MTTTEPDGFGGIDEVPGCFRLHEDELGGLERVGVVAVIDVQGEDSSSMDTVEEVRVLEM